MADVLFPRLSEKEPDAEGVLATWFVGDGDQVASGQLLGEVMVDKVSAEVVAPTSGRVRLLVSEDQAVRQGEVIARVALPRAARQTWPWSLPGTGLSAHACRRRRVLIMGAAG